MVSGNSRIRSERVGAAPASADPPLCYLNGRYRPTLLPVVPGHGAASRQLRPRVPRGQRRARPPSRGHQGGQLYPGPGQALGNPDPGAVSRELLAQTRSRWRNCCADSPKTGSSPVESSGRVAHRSSTVCRDGNGTVPIPSGSVFDRLTSRRPDPSGSHVMSDQVATASPLPDSLSRITDAWAMSKQTAPVGVRQRLESASPSPPRQARLLPYGGEAALRQSTRHALRSARCPAQHPHSHPHLFVLR